jgi:type I restriction enzyme, R subunit
MNMTEDQLEQEALGWLASVGYTPLNARDSDLDPRLVRASSRDVVLVPCLRGAIDRLNPAVPAAAREDAFRRVLDMGQPALLSGNRAFHRVMVTGVPVQYQKDGETRGDFVRLVDWQDTTRNEWLAVQQFSIKGPRRTRRPDIILFVNGLPLVLIELKNPADLNADIWKAFDQIQTYKEQIADVFTYNGLLVIADGTEARMGSLSATAERFMQWRTIDGVALDPLGKFQELETLVRGILSPANLLDYLRFFVLFEDDGKLVKKVAGYHQFHAVRAAVEQVVRAASTLDEIWRGKGGVVWHTQGSGKSITMTCFAARVMQEPRLENPTIVVITDRNDLDGQLMGVFSLSQDLLREQPQQARTRQELRELLDNRPSGGIVFTTIQKFMPGEDEDTFPVLSQRRNIVVIADEAHRTQYGFEAKLKSRKVKDGASPAVAYTTGDSQTVASTADFAPPEYQVKYQAGYAQHLRDALPNATFVAFTGTPVSSTDRDTRSVFGEYIHVYDMQQAQEDGATVAIYYESRLAKLSLNEADITHLDDEVDELAEDEEESQQAKLKSHWAALEKVVGSSRALPAWRQTWWRTLRSATTRKTARPWWLL